MDLQEIFNTSFKSLLKNKIRAFLTMLGVVIGVFAVVSLVSLVQGVENFIVDRFNALGSNLIIISPGRANFQGDPAIAFTNSKLEEKHVDMIRQDLKGEIIGVTPTIRTGKIAKYKTNEFFITVSAGNVQINQLFDLEIEEGRFFTELEQKSRSKVAVLGPKVVEELFSNENPIDKDIKIGDTTFKVIGYFHEKNEQMDDRIIMPYTTASYVFNIDNFSGLAAKAIDPNEIDTVMTHIRVSLLKDLKDDEFTVLSQEDILQSIQEIIGVLQIGLTAIAGISLVVGGIGIMNIMLVSVTERTKEIGLRKALGATRKSIAVQFLIEAVFISTVGGLFGLGAGYLATFAAQRWLRAQVPWWSVLLSFGFSFIVGVAFGTYPAISASKKDPIKALTYE